MDIQIAEKAPMSQTGSSILRIIQNHEMPLLDLIVRETVQNSTDASIADADHVGIEYNIRSFDPLEICRELNGVGDNLLTRCGNKKHKLLEIRDSNTIGLIGPTSYSEVIGNNTGNFLNLVYEISRPQEKEGAGGSWGLGKTVLFRIGMGLVFYYSRIRKGNGFESRFSACLVENENGKETLIGKYKGENQRGIAWWGKAYAENRTKPLTDEAEIKEILNMIGVRSYIGEETGTTIVIPFIDEDRLLKDTNSAEESEESNQQAPWWLSSVSDYLKIAIQRWYAPRIMNKYYRYGSWIKASVNGELIENGKMLPFFRIIQELYNSTFYDSEVIGEYTFLKNADSKIDIIHLKNTFLQSQIAGKVAYAKFNREQLHMNPPHNNASPFVLLDLQDGETNLNRPIVTYTRKPGMLISYKMNGSWTDKIPKTNTDEYIIGIFVPNSVELMKKSEGTPFEEYLRRCEKADHTDWSDWSIGGSKSTIVQRIQSKVSKSIADSYSEQVNPVNTYSRLGLGRVLAEKLLPTEGFGTAPIEPGRGGKSGNNRVMRSHKLVINGNPSFEDDKIIIEFEVQFGKKCREADIHLHVLSESGSINANSWEKIDVIGIPFPLSIDEIEIEKIKLPKSKRPYEARTFYINKQKNKNEFMGIRIQMNKTKTYDIPYGFNVSLPDDATCSLVGKMKFKSNNSEIQGGLELELREGAKK